MLRQARGIGEQMHAGARARGKGGEIAAQRIDIVHDDTGVIEQAFAGRRQLHAAAAALEQRNAQRKLQAFDALADAEASARWTRSAPAVMLRLFRHRDEELQIDQIETHGMHPPASCLRHGRRQSP